MSLVYYFFGTQYIYGYLLSFKRYNNLMVEICVISLFLPCQSCLKPSQRGMTVGMKTPIVPGLPEVKTA